MILKSSLEIILEVISLENKEKEVSKEIISIIIISIGSLSALSLFSDKMGIVGRLLKNIFLTLMGFGGYIFPLLIISIGILLIMNKLNFPKDKKVIFLLVIFLCFITILDINKVKSNSFKEHLNLSLNIAKADWAGE